MNRIQWLGVAGHSDKLLDVYLTNGKMAPDKSYYEGVFNHDLMMCIAEVARDKGVNYTPLNPGPLPVRESTIVKSVNKVYNAKGRPPMVLSSLHSNAMGSSGWNDKADGLTILVNESWHPVRSKRKLSPTSSKIADTMIDHFDGLPIDIDRGVQGRRLYILRATAMPAILTEHGFHTNKRDLEFLKDLDYRWTLAERHVDGMLECEKIFQI